MTKEERQLFEGLKKEVAQLRNEQSIYCDPDWLIEIATFLINTARTIGGDPDEAYEIAYGATCKKFNITEEGLKKIHLRCGIEDNHIDRLKKVKFLKEEIMNRPTLLCPFMVDKDVIHMRKSNRAMVDWKYDNRVDYDMHRPFFKPCIKTACMMYNQATGTCKRQ